jgi:hypothetical protein
MQIKGSGRLALAGGICTDVRFTLTTGEGFAAGRGELHGDPDVLAAAFHAASTELHFVEWGDPLEVMLVGAPDGNIADFVPIGASPRYWDE